MSEFTATNPSTAEFINKCIEEKDDKRLAETTMNLGKAIIETPPTNQQFRKLIDNEMFGSIFAFITCGYNISNVFEAVQTEAQFNVLKKIVIGSKLDTTPLLNSRSPNTFMCLMLLETGKVLEIFKNAAYSQLFLTTDANGNKLSLDILNSIITPELVKILDDNACPLTSMLDNEKIRNCTVAYIGRKVPFWYAKISDMILNNDNTGITIVVQSQPNILVSIDNYELY